MVSHADEDGGAAEPLAAVPGFVVFPFELLRLRENMYLRHTCLLGGENHPPPSGKFIYPPINPPPQKKPDFVAFGGKIWLFWPPKADEFFFSECLHSGGARILSCRPKGRSRCSRTRRSRTSLPRSGRRGGPPRSCATARDTALLFLLLVVPKDPGAPPLHSGSNCGGGMILRGCIEESPASGCGCKRGGTFFICRRGVLIFSPGRG